MNWIKITPETELPKDTGRVILVKLKGMPYEYAIVNKLTRSTPYVYAFYSHSWHPVTHYCIITNPEQ